MVGAEHSSSRRRAGVPRLWNDQDHWLKWRGAINQVILGASLLSGVVAKGRKWQRACNLSLSDVVDSSGRRPSPWERGGPWKLVGTRPATKTQTHAGEARVGVKGRRCALTGPLGPCGRSRADG